jgi:hypothetical protein
LIASAFVLSLVWSSTQTASALSCARPDIARSFQYWNDAPQEYVIARGVLTSTMPVPKMPKRSGNINKPNKPTPRIYKFSGVAIGETRNMKWASKVIVAPSCAGPWCAGYPESGAEAVMALEKTSFGYRLNLGPCGGNIFTQDLEAKENALRQCLSGKCPPSLGR